MTKKTPTTLTTRTGLVIDNVVSVDALDENVSEAQFQQAVINLARALNYRPYHHTTAGGKCRECGTRVGGGRIVTSKGWPDLVIARADPPRLIFAELKSQAGRMRPDQKVWRAILEANGAEYYCWRPSNWNEIVRVLEGNGV